MVTSSPGLTVIVWVSNSSESRPSISTVLASTATAASTIAMKSITFNGLFNISELLCLTMRRVGSSFCGRQSEHLSFRFPLLVPT